MSAVLDMQGSGATLEVNDDNGVYYSIPQDEGEPIIVTNADIEKWNTELLVPVDETGKIAKVFKAAGPASKRGDSAQMELNLLGEISDLITPKNIRSMILNKDVWRSRDSQGHAQSFADQFTERDLTFDLTLPMNASVEMLALDTDPDGILTPAEMTGADLKGIIELMLHEDNFRIAKDELVGYAKGRMELQVKAYQQPKSESEEINTVFEEED
jgi:hypothetical protein